MTNDEIDAAILRHLAADGPLSFSVLCSRVQHEAGARALDVFRPVDRRLQVLRKAGRIVPDRRIGWSLAPAASQGNGT